MKGFNKYKYSVDWQTTRFVNRLGIGMRLFEGKLIKKDGGNREPKQMENEWEEGSRNVGYV